MNDMVLGLADILAIFGIVLALQALVVPFLLALFNRDYKPISTLVNNLELKQEKQKEEINYLRECITDMAGLIITSNTYNLQLIGCITKQVDISVDCPNQREQTGKLNRDLVRVLLEFQLINRNSSIKRSAMHSLESGYANDTTRSLIDRANFITEE